MNFDPSKPPDEVPFSEMFDLSTAEQGAKQSVEHFKTLHARAANPWTEPSRLRSERPNLEEPVESNEDLQKRYSTLPAPAETEMPDLGAPLTAARHEALGTQVLLERMGLGEMPTPPEPPNWLEARGLRFEPVVTNHVIEENILVIAKAALHDPSAAALLGEWAQPKRANSGLAGDEFARVLAARAEEFYPGSPTAAFLKGFAAGDCAAMRNAVRELLSAEM